MSTDDFDTLLRRRMETLAEWFRLQDTSSLDDQKHLDAGSAERLYWHLGYYVAISDLQQARAGFSMPEGCSAGSSRATQPDVPGGQNFH